MSDKCKHCKRCVKGCDPCACCGVCQRCGMQTRPTVNPSAPPVYVPTFWFPIEPRPWPPGWIISNTDKIGAVSETVTGVMTAEWS